MNITNQYVPMFACKKRGRRATPRYPNDVKVSRHREREAFGTSFYIGENLAKTACFRVGDYVAIDICENDSQKYKIRIAGTEDQKYKLSPAVGREKGTAKSLAAEHAMVTCRFRITGFDPATVGWVSPGCNSAFLTVVNIGRDFIEVSVS
jgi:hypothetical protein